MIFLKEKFLLTTKATITQIEKSISLNSTKLLTAINVNILHHLAHSIEFKKTYGLFDFINFDGYYAIIWAKLIFKFREVEQLSADILLKEIYKLSELKNWSIYALGGSKDTVDLFASKIHENYPKTNILGHQHGYFKKEEEKDIINEICTLHPDILLVGLSVPKEHEWVIANKDRLNAKIIITCGGYIQQTSAEGISYYPSDWIYRMHINWIYRIIKDPMRLFGRYLIQGIWFLYWLPKQYLKYKY